jgi:methionyl-tRNA formyltransferase
MNIAFFGQTGPYGPAALRQLLGQHGVPYYVRVVVDGIGRQQSRRSHRWFAPKRCTLPPQEDLTQTAVAAGIDTLQTSDVNAPYVACELARRRIDVIVCAGFPCLFGPALLACATRGALNAHPSLLPRWRGPSPIFWALRQGDNRLGVTIHHIDAQEDHGPVIAQEAFALRPRESGKAIYGHAGMMAGRMLADALRHMAQGSLCAVPQLHSRAIRAPRPKPEDACVTPVTWGCARLVNFASGAAFFRAPWMVLGGDTYHVRTGLQASPGQRLPGDFVVHGDRLLVPCKDGTAMLQLQT